METALKKVWSKCGGQERTSFLHHFETQQKAQKANTLTKKKELTKEALILFIQGTNEMYEKVLLFVPLELNDIYMQLSEEFKVTKPTLLQLLDTLAIFVTINPRGEKAKKKNNNKKKEKEKEKSCVSKKRKQKQT